VGVVLLIGIVVGAIVVFAMFSHDAQVKRALKKAPLAKINALAEGRPGKIVGAVRPFEQVLTAPLSGRRCVYWIVRVEQRRHTGKSSHWRKIIEEHQGVPFTVDDGTGHAIVDARNAKIALDTDMRTKSGTFDNPTPQETEFLSRHRVSGQGLVFNKQLRYAEAVIEENEVVAVLGAGVREPDPGAPPADAYRGEQPTRVRMTSSPQHPLVVSDSPSVTARPS
jgi:hypothetical protein